MREFKFRAYVLNPGYPDEPKNYYMTYNVIIIPKWYAKIQYPNQTGKVMCHPITHTNLLYSIHDDYEKLMQYTGLKDRNGNEIYEGDVIDTPHRGIEEVKIDQEYDFIGYHLCWEKGKILGNVYENPELIENN